MDSQHSTKDYQTTVTVSLVQRIAEYLAMGFPLRLALAKDKVAAEEYELELRRRPELAKLEDAAKADFLKDSINTLLDADDPSQNIRWLLERLYPEIFNRGPQSPAPKAQPTVVGMTEEELHYLQQEALKL